MAEHGVADTVFNFYTWTGVDALGRSHRTVFITTKPDGETEDREVMFVGDSSALSVVVDRNGNEWVVDDDDDGGGDDDDEWDAPGEATAMRCCVLVGPATGMYGQVYALDRAMHRGVGQATPPPRRWGF